jgi:FSR family fosmidomycin resistance protein-like MFS transporter
VPRGQASIAWFSLAARLAISVLVRIGGWYKRKVLVTAGKAGPKREPGTALTRRTILASIAILMVLVFSKNFYTASLTNYLSFYLIDRFGLSVQQAQVCLFVYLGAVALGAVLGGPVMDRVGRKYVIWFSILGALPFTLALPHVGLVWTGVLLVLVGLIMSASLSAIVVYAQELVPGRVGTMSGLFLGLSFGMGGLGAALLGELADRTSIGFVYQVCAYLPAIGLVAALLPSMKPAEPNR